MADDLPEYTAHLLTCECVAQPCVMPVEVHHPKHCPTHVPWARPSKALPGKPGKGQRSSDWFGLPMCPQAHADLHAKRGQFADMSREELRAWQDRAIEKMHQRWAMQHGGRLPEVVVPPERPSRLRKRRTKPSKLRAIGRAAVASASHDPLLVHGGADHERARIVRVIRARAAARHHLPDHHQLLSELASDIEDGADDTGAF